MRASRISDPPAPTTAPGGKISGADDHPNECAARDPNTTQPRIPPSGIGSVERGTRSSSGAPDAPRQPTRVGGRALLDSHSTAVVYGAEHCTELHRREGLAIARVSWRAMPDRLAATGDSRRSPAYRSNPPSGSSDDPGRRHARPVERQRTGHTERGPPTSMTTSNDANCLTMAPDIHPDFLHIQRTTLMAKKRTPAPTFQNDGYANSKQRPATLDNSQQQTHGPFNSTHAAAVNRAINERKGQSPFDADPKKHPAPKPPRGGR